MVRAWSDAKLAKSTHVESVQAFKASTFSNWGGWRREKEAIWRGSRERNRRSLEEEGERESMCDVTFLPFGCLECHFPPKLAHVLTLAFTFQCLEHAKLALTLLFQLGDDSHTFTFQMLLAPYWLANVASNQNVPNHVTFITITMCSLTLHAT